MSNTNLVLGSNWSMDEWPEYVAVYHEGTCDGMRVYVPERTCKFVPFVEEDGSVFVENCSECDCAVLARCRFKYCPDCGARVVK